jgi:hypothetical protein
MRTLISKILIATLFTVSATIATPVFAQTTKKATDKPKAPAKEKAKAPTAAEIADAKAKGMVWVNLNTKVYHSDGQFYGKTTNGKFMTEADAKAAGYRAAKEPAAKKTDTTKKTTPDTKKK